jgi:hypothetical protein
MIKIYEININQAGGYLENRIICYHLPINSPIVLLRPKLD